MTIQYQPGAAGISWLALCDTIKNRAEMQKELLELSAVNSKVQIDMTKLTADQSKNELDNQANGLFASGIGGLVGAGLSGLSMGLTYAKQLPLDQQAKALNAPIEGLENQINTLNSAQDTQVSAREVEANAPEQGEPRAIPNVSAEIEGENPANAVAAPEETNLSETTNVQKKELIRKQSNLAREQADLQNASRAIVDRGHLIAQTLNTAASNAGTMGQASYKLNESKAKALEALAQGLASVMNNQYSMLNSSIDSASRLAADTEQVITTIISVSAVRA